MYVYQKLFLSTNISDRDYLVLTFDITLSVWQY